MITNTLNTIRTTRRHLLNLLDGLTPEQLNQVPAGFNNNIIWNVAHLISAQQGICYTRAELPVKVDDQYFTPYRPGTKPDTFIVAEEIDQIKKLLISTIDQLETDLNDQIFTNYPQWTTRYGVEITTIEEAVNFLPFHDGMHIGYVMAQKRVLTA
jgi:hypothetical protein